MNKNILVTKLFVIITVITCAGQLPDTDIFLFKARSTGKSHSFGEAKNITNRIGYDNQPCFSPDSKELLFVAVEDSGQSEIRKYNSNTTLKIKPKHRLQPLKKVNTPLLSFAAEQKFQL